MSSQSFLPSTKKKALKRQKNKCGSCGTGIELLGKAGRGKHLFGEGAEAHHMKHIKFGGTKSIDNCVILCKSCHHNAHEGGKYRTGTVMGTKKDFRHFRG